MEENVNAKEMRITPVDKANLATAGKWAKFIAIVDFVMLGLSVIAIVFMLLGMTIAGIALPGVGAEAMTFMTVYMIVMLAFMLIAFLPALYMFRFAQNAIEAADGDGTGEDVTDSLANLRRYFKFNGILLAIVIAFLLISVIVGIVVGVGSAIGVASTYM